MDHGEIARSLCSSSVVTPTHFSLAHLFMQSWQRALAKMENVYSSVYCRRFMNNNEYRTTTLYILHLYIYIIYRIFSESRDADFPFWDRSFSLAPRKSLQVWFCLERSNSAAACNVNLQVAMIVTNGVCLSIDLKDLGSSILCYRSSPWITILIHTPCITFNLEKKVASIIFWLQATLAFLYFLFEHLEEVFFPPKKTPWHRVKQVHWMQQPKP